MSEALSKFIGESKIKCQTHFEILRSQYTTLVLAFYGVASLILLLRLLQDASWLLLFAPFFVSGLCGLLSAANHFIKSNTFQNAILVQMPVVFNRIIPPQVSSKIMSIILLGQMYLRASVNRITTSEVYKQNKYLRFIVQSLNGKSIIVCILILFLYATGNGFLWTQRASSVSGEGSENMMMKSPPTKPGYPSITRPLIFLHIPGSGGVSFRKALHSDALALGANKFLPCFDGLKCAINTDQEFNKTFIHEQQFASQLTIMQREMRCAVVIGGHFKMSLLGVLSALDRVSSSNACPSRQWHISPTSAPNFNAIVILRNPLNRIISHYYRFGNNGPNKGRSFSDLSSSEMEDFLQTNGVHLVVSYLTFQKITDFKNIAEATTNAMKNLHHCTVGVFEYWEDSVEIFQHKNPWMNPPQLERSSSEREDPSSLDPSILGLLINKLVAEMRIYEFALKRFRKEMKATPKLTKKRLTVDPIFEPQNDNYYRHFVAEPFPFP